MVFCSYVIDKIESLLENATCDYDCVFVNLR